MNVGLDLETIRALVHGRCMYMVEEVRPGSAAELRGWNRSYILGTKSPRVTVDNDHRVFDTYQRFSQRKPVGFQVRM